MLRLFFHDKIYVQNMSDPQDPSTPLSYRQIFNTWWPLAFSWMLMGVEIPLISAVIARLDDPEIHLAAFGSIVYPLGLIIEAPVIMLLSASTALAVHRQAYDRMWRFMMVAGAAMTLLHILIAFTPLYDIVIRGLIHPPEAVIEPARWGLMVMTPWTWAIGYRRFNQGVMIRHGYSGAVGFGTILRLAAGGTLLFLLYRFSSLPGAVVGSTALATAVTVEAVYAGWRVRPILRGELARPSLEPQLTWRAFFDFYIPLVLTSFISLGWQPVGSAALSRMPGALNSLAVWPVLSGLNFLLRTLGLALNEVVVALMGRQAAYRRLLRFTVILALITTSAHLLLVATPLAGLYFTHFSALPPHLTEMARLGLWISLPMPGVAAFQNWFQGILLYGKRTRAIPQSVTVFFLTAITGLGAGVAYGQIIGLYVAAATFVLAFLAQSAWLGLRSRAVTRKAHSPEVPGE